MLAKVYSIYDVKTCVYNVPFFQPTVQAALRTFGDLANDKRSTVNQHPEDYILYEIGTFDDGKGVLVSLPNPVHLGHASDFVLVRPDGGERTALVEQMEMVDKNGKRVEVMK